MRVHDKTLFEWPVLVYWLDVGIPIEINHKTTRFLITV